MVFFQFAQRMAHRDAIGIGDVLASQLPREFLAIAVAQASRLDVGQAAPGIAAGGLQSQRGSVVPFGPIELAQMHECIARQDMGRKKVRCQRRGALQRRERFFAFAQQLQIATQVEPVHGLVRRDRGGATPVGDRTFAIAAGDARAGKIAQALRVVRPKGQRALEQFDGFVVTPLHAAQDAQ